MGQGWSSFYSYWFPNKEYKLVLVGLDNAGKTTTLYRLHLGQAVTTHPTVGSNVEQISFRNLEFEVLPPCLMLPTHLLLFYCFVGLFHCFDSAGMGFGRTSKSAAILADIL